MKEKINSSYSKVGRKYCTDHEQYEDAKMLTEMLKRDYEECFKNTGKAKGDIK